MQEPLITIPQPEEISTREKEDAMGSYLMMFAAMAVGLPLPIINLIASIIYYFINRSKSTFVHFHVLQSLFSQIPTTILNAGLIFWSVRIYFFNYQITDYFYTYAILVAISNVLYFVFSIIAAVKARNGRLYYFLVFGRLAYQIAFSPKSISAKKPVNTPPSF